MFPFPDLHFAILNLQFAIVPAPRPAESEQPPPRAPGALVSLGFWLSLLLSGGLFAAATLSGKLLDTERRAAELAALTAKVEQLALDVHRLELEARALENDSDYIAAVARQKLGPADVQGCRLFEDGDDVLGERGASAPCARARTDAPRTMHSRLNVKNTPALADVATPAALEHPTPPPPIAAGVDPRLEPLRHWLHRIAGDSLLRARLLIAAAALVLFGFTFLHEGRRRDLRA